MPPHPAGAPEAADHFVRHEQQAIFAHHRLDLGPIVLGRDDHPARALHRLADEGGAIFGADLENLVLDRLDTGVAIFLLAHPLPFTIIVRLADLLATGDRQVALPLHRLHSADTPPLHGPTLIRPP